MSSNMRRGISQNFYNGHGLGGSFWNKSCLKSIETKVSSLPKLMIGYNNQLRFSHGIAANKWINNNLNGYCIYGEKYTLLNRRYFCTNKNEKNKSEKGKEKGKIGKSKSKSKSKSTMSENETNMSEFETQGNENAQANIQATEERSQVSTFVQIKEKTEEGMSLIYIFGVLFTVFPYTIYIVFRSLFSESGPDKIKNDSFELLRDDPRVVRALGSDVYSRHVSHNSTFIDNEGNERLQVIYEIQGSKGEGRVDVEMVKESDGQWHMQYTIVSTKFTTIPVVDNRPLYARPM